MKKLFTASMFALICSACTDAGRGGPPLSAQECEAVIRKGWDLQEIPIETITNDENGKKLFDRTVQGCAQNHEISRKDYDCLMKATTMDAYQGCHATMR
jgi:hypothetical protein